jgi:hypothetical protein
VTLIAIGSADGTVLPPAYIMQGQCHMSNYLGKCHYYPNSGLFLKKETHMMDGLVPQSPELTLQAAKICMQQEVPKPTVDKATLPHDLQAELHVPVEHLQLQRSRQPQQEKRKMLRIDGFVTQEGWSQAFNQNAKAKAAAAPGPSQPKKKCGRPPGSKNKRKLVEEDSE